MQQCISSKSGCVIVFCFRWCWRSEVNICGCEHYRQSVCRIYDNETSVVHRRKQRLNIQIMYACNMCSVHTQNIQWFCASRYLKGSWHRLLHQAVFLFFVLVWFFIIYFLFCPPSVLFLWRMLTAVMMLTHGRDLTGLLNWAHTMGLSGLPPNKKHELCNYATTVSYFAVKHEETPLCELFITRTCSKPSCYESSLQCEITKPSVFGNSLVTLCRWMHTSRN